MKNLDESVKKPTEKIALSGKYLTFSLAGEEYGIEILKVKEIIGMMTVTPIPRLPAFVKGVINLRGKVIPVIDLRLKFGIEAAEYSERTCIIVVEIKDGDKTVPIGLVVDSVSEVLNVHGDQVESPPSFGTRLQTGYILGMAKDEKSVKILLDIDHILTAETMEMLRDDVDEKIVKGGEHHD